MTKLITCVLGLMLVAGTASAELLVRNGFVRGLPPGQSNTAAFMRLQNTGTEPVTVTSVWSDAAERTEIHGHQQRDGMMRMAPVESLTVPAGDAVVLKTGGYHLMLIGLHKPLSDGDKVMIRLQTGSDQQIEQQLPVRSVLSETHQHQHGS